MNSFLPRRGKKRVEQEKNEQTFHKLQSACGSTCTKIDDENVMFDEEPPHSARPHSVGSKPFVRFASHPEN